MAALTNVIDPPPRLTGDPKQDTVAIIQWLSQFYVKGILANGIQQTANVSGQFSTDHPMLVALEALSGVADEFAYFTGVNAFALTQLTAFARTLLSKGDAATARTALGAGTVTAVGGTAPITSSGGNTPNIGISDFVASGAAHARGAVPDPGAAAGAVKFLREDATWATPSGAGDVVGPGGATDNHVAFFDGASGKLIKDSGLLLSGSNTGDLPYSEHTAASVACAGAITTAAVWKATKNGNIVVLTLPIVLGTASASAFFTFGEALPANFRPSASFKIPCVIEDNGIIPTAPGGVFIDSTTGTIFVTKDLPDAGNFTAAPNAGLPNGATVAWTI